MRLTKKQIDKAEYEGGTDYRWDDTLPGFGLRVYPSGRKSFVVAYQARGRKRIMVLGRFGRLTAKQARVEARKVLGQVAQGEDPAGQRSEERRAPTMEELAERYMREHAEPKKKPSSVKGDRALWRRHLLPHLGKRKVADVSRADVAALHARIGKTAPGAANRVLALLSKAFNLAEVWGWRPDGSNPCRHVQRFRERRMERFLSPIELSRLGDALAAAEKEGEPPAAILVLRLLALTGCRSGEVLGLRWSEVDLANGCLRLSDSKTGAKVVYLGAPALELLARTEPVPGNPYVCAGRIEGKHFVGLSHVWERIRRKAGLDDVRVHDLRHSFASVGARAGLSLPIIGKLLGHTVPQTTARYAHLAGDPLRHAADLVAKEVAANLSGESAAPALEIRRSATG